MQKTKFIGVKNQANDSTLEIYFLDIIQDGFDWWTGMQTSAVQQLIDQVNAAKPSKIICFIDSEGGDAQTGISIYNFLKLNSAKVECRIIGLAGSIASVIAMAASKGKLFIARNGFMMIHKAEGMAWGTSDELRQLADVVDKYTGQIVDIYAQRTGKSADEINALIANGDFWMSGQECVDQGFADDTFNDFTQDLQIAARLNTDVYKNYPQAIRAQLQNKPPAEGDLETQINDFMKFGEKIANLFKNHKPANAAAPITGSEIGSIMQPGLDEFETSIENRITEMNNGIATQVNTAVANAVAAIPPPAAPVVPDVNAAITAMLAQTEGENPLRTAITNAVNVATQSLKTENEALKTQLTALLGKQGNSGNGGGDNGYQVRGQIRK